MKVIKTSLLVLSILVLGCTNSSQPEDKKSVEEQKPSANKFTDRTGNYVDDSYKKRSEGYDWVAVSVNQLSSKEIEIKVRSRADKKKPTCTFDVHANKVNDSTYQGITNGKYLIISFSGDQLTISGKSEEDQSILAFYCSGGASLAGNYSKIEGPLDATIDPTIYSKVLMLQGIGFNVSTSPDDKGVKLTIMPFGLSEDNTPFEKYIEGKITDSEIEDLNSDGFPELLVYTQTGPNDLGYVEAVSVNNGKSMSLAYFRPTTEDKRISEGYNGHDQFTLVETMLGQRFPIYENGKPTGKNRQVMYSLKDGEAMRFFELQNVSEY